MLTKEPLKRHNFITVKWNEMKWNEMKWNEMKWALRSWLQIKNKQNTLLCVVSKETVFLSFDIKLT